MAFVRDGLEAHDEREEVEAMVEQILGWGNGAHRQRKVWKEADGDGARSSTTCWARRRRAT